MSKGQGVKKYEIAAALDSRTSEICRELDGKRFPVSEYKAGVTAPPFHVFCRSAVRPCLDMDVGKIKRDEQISFYVPEKMRFEEWKGKFARGNTNDINTSEIGDK